MTTINSLREEVRIQAAERVRLEQINKQLLDALEAVCDTFDAHCPGNREAFNAFSMSVWMARSAIAAAKGE